MDETRIKALLKQYLYDCIPRMVLAVVWLTLVPIFVVYSPIDYNISAKGVLKSILLRWAYPIASILGFSFIVSRFKRFFAILKDMKQLQTEQCLLSTFILNEEQLDISKVKRLRIDMREPKPDGNMFTDLWELNISHLNEFLLDTRLCSLDDMQRIERKMRKQGRKYRITYMKHSRIVISVWDIYHDTEICSFENADF